MTALTPPSFDFGLPAPVAGEDAPEFLAARALAFSAERVLRLSRAFAEAGRAIDLTGLHLVIGRLTASVLDLDLTESRRLRPDLVNLLASLDVLERTLIAMHPAAGAQA